MRVLVAGGSGFIGGATVERLVALGMDVTVMTAHPARSEGWIRSLGAVAVEGDVLRPHTLHHAVEGADAVVQALTFPTFPVERPRRRYTFGEFDHRGTARLVAAARHAGVRRYVFVSGSGAAPHAERVWFRAKWHGEEAVRASGLEHAIVRPSWVYGPRDVALNRLLWFARHAPVVPVVGDGRQVLQPVFVDEVAEVLVRAARPGGPEGTFEVGGPEVMTMDDVLRTAMEVMGRRRPLLHVPVRVAKAGGWFARLLPRPLLSPDAVSFLTGDAIADIGPLVEAFGITPRRLRDGLATYLRP
jgi:NADH dehydrogenase